MYTTRVSVPIVLIGYGTGILILRLRPPAGRHIHRLEKALLRWQGFATTLLAVFCLPYHRGVSTGGKYRCSMHHALRVQVYHLSRSLPLMPH